jgi:hypothetical protein
LAELQPVFDRLKDILEPYARRIHVSADDPTGFSVDRAPAPERSPTTWFGAVRLGKRYVSYYLMPVYGDPTLLETVSLELRRRMHGKSCFNFTAVDERLLHELEALTRVGYARTAGDPAWQPPRPPDRATRRQRASAFDVAATTADLAAASGVSRPRTRSGA